MQNSSVRTSSISWSRPFSVAALPYISRCFLPRKSSLVKVASGVNRAAYSSAAQLPSARA